MLFFFQMDDIDVSRCREGRLNYLGWISFIAIAVLMSFLLVNENIGDAFVNMILPCFYTGILALGAALYSASLAALLPPFCVVIGIIIYRRLVYRPAKEAHNRRKDTLKSSRSNGDFASSRNLFREAHGKPIANQNLFSNGLFTYLSRVLTILKNCIIAGIANLSKRKLKKYATHRAACIQKWCIMNVPATYQGAGLGEDIEIHTDHVIPVRRASLHLDQARANVVHISIPSEIKAMMTSIIKCTSRHGDEYNISAVTGPSSKQLNLHLGDDLVVIKPSEKRHMSRHLRPVIIFDTGEALLRIWSNTSARAARHTFIDDGRLDENTVAMNEVERKEDDNDDMVIEKDENIVKDSHQGQFLQAFEVLVPDLFIEFEDIFNYFYPDGISISGLEREEMSELFAVWIQEQVYQSIILLDGSVFCEIQTIHFKLFHNWFFDLIKMMHDIMSDRLMNYVLSSSNLSDNTGTRMIPKNAKLSMKLLSLLTSHDLRKADEKYSVITPEPPTIPSNIPVKPSGEIAYTANPLRGSPRNLNSVRNPMRMNSQKSVSFRDLPSPVDGDDIYSAYSSTTYGGSFYAATSDRVRLNRGSPKFAAPLSGTKPTDLDDIYSTYSYSNTSYEGSFHNSLSPKMRVSRGLRKSVTLSSVLSEMKAADSDSNSPFSNTTFGGSFRDPITPDINDKRTPIKFDRSFLLNREHLLGSNEYLSSEIESPYEGSLYNSIPSAGRPWKRPVHLLDSNSPTAGAVMSTRSPRIFVYPDGTARVNSTGAILQSNDTEGETLRESSIKICEESTNMLSAHNIEDMEDEMKAAI